MIMTNGTDLYVMTEEERVRSEIIDLIWRKCGAQGDMIRQLATVLVAEGYRKFEIVEGDV